MIIIERARGTGFQLLVLDSKKGFGKKIECLWSLLKILQIRGTSYFSKAKQWLLSCKG
jgi:hypothetical protein